MAAQQEHISQSATSSTISQLERAVGLQLLLRHHATGVVPTAEGRVSVEHARTLLHDARHRGQVASDLGDATAGPFELGCLVTWAPIVLPSWCGSFINRHPDTTFRVLESGQDGCRRQLEEGRISLALTDAWAR